MIDMRSDTVTRPTPAMRQAMAQAEVGDDVYGEDPTVRALEKRTAEILGKEKAVYVPTGTMSNEIAVRTHTEAGDEVLADLYAHVYLLEGGAPAALSGVAIRPLMGTNGIFSAEDVIKALRTPHPFMPNTVTPPQKLLCVENTHNVGGGTIWPLETIRSVSDVARRHGLATHLDGARLWNASAATGIPEADYAAPFDTVNVCFSKGLGAPVGSALAGRADLIERARRFKQMFGGGFRQAGVIAAGALHALEHHRERLTEDHARAKRFAAELDHLSGIEIDLGLVQTNIVRFRVTSVPSGTLVERCYQEGLHVLPSGVDGVRAVLHMEISEGDVDEALAIVRKALAKAR